MSFSDIGTGSAPSTIRPAQRASIASAVNSNGYSGGGSGGAHGDASDLAESLRKFQVCLCRVCVASERIIKPICPYIVKTELTSLNTRITEMKRRLNSEAEKME